MFSEMPNIDTPWGVGSSVDACIVIISPNVAPASLIIQIKGNEQATQPTEREIVSA